MLKKEIDYHFILGFYAGSTEAHTNDSILEMVEHGGKAYIKLNNHFLSVEDTELMNKELNTFQGQIDAGK